MSSGPLPRRLLIAAGALFLLEALIFAILAAATHDAFGPMDPPGSTDFISFYVAGRQALTGQAGAIYDVAAHWAAERAQYGDDRLPIYWFFYPPSYVPLCAALATLPYLPAFLLFTFGSLGLAGWALARILDDWRRLALFATYPPIFYTIGLGQNSFLSTALFGFGLMQLDRRPILAGLFLAAESFKPHFLILTPVALIAGQRWRVLAMFLLGSAAMLALPVLIFGLGVLDHYALTMRRAGEVFGGGEIPFSGQVSVFAAIRLLGGGEPLAWLAQSAAIVAAAFAIWRLWRQPGMPALQAAGLVAASLLAAPVILFYDLTPLSLAIAWLLVAVGHTDRTERRTLCVIWLITGLALWLGEALRLPLGWLAPAGLLWLILRARRQLGGETEHTQTLFTNPG